MNDRTPERQKAILSVLARRRGPAGEGETARRAALAAKDDWWGDCRRCGQSRIGTPKALREPCPSCGLGREGAD